MKCTPTYCLRCGLALFIFLEVNVSTADADFLAVTWDGDVIVIDESTGLSRSIGRSGTSSLNSFARDSEGRYTTINTGSGVHRLWSVDPVLGLATEFHLPFLNDVRALGAPPGIDLVLYAVESSGGGTDNELYLLDLSVQPGDASVKQYIGDMRIDAVQAMAFRADGALFAWSVTHGLITIDPGTAVTTDVNSQQDGDAEVQTLSFGADGQLYGAANNLYVIDTATGIRTRVGSTSYPSVRGMDFLPEGPIAYCEASPNSTGFSASISWDGTTSIAFNDFIIEISSIPPRHSAVIVYSPDPVQIPFGNGNLCVGNVTLGFVVREVSGSSTPEGTFVHAFDFHSPTAPEGQIVAGSTWYFSCWFRDLPAGDSGFNFANGLCATFSP